MDCASTAQWLYALPPFDQAASAYAFGVALVLVPWLVSLAGSRVISALRLSFYGSEE